MTRKIMLLFGLSRMECVIIQTLRIYALECLNPNSTLLTIIRFVMIRQTRTVLTPFDKDTEASNQNYLMDLTFGCKMEQPDVALPQIKAEFNKPIQAEPERAPTKTAKRSKPGQSKLHNCPKHLIKVLIQALELTNAGNLRLGLPFVLMPLPIQSALCGLLNLLLLTHQGKIRSTSKELLKLVFETGSEYLQRLTLLANPYIRGFFSRHDPQSVAIAKTMLRAFAIDRLLRAKTTLIGSSRITRKDINIKYLEIFIKELNEGLIKERISKADKIRILQECREEEAADL